MRSKIQCLFFILLFWVTAHAQKYDISWLPATLVPDSLEIFSVSANANLSRLCVVGRSKSNSSYIIITDRIDAENWTPGHLALNLPRLAIYPQLSSDGNRIYLEKEVEYEGNVDKEIKPGVIYSTNKMGIFVSEFLSKDKWDSPSLLSKELVDPMIFNSFAISPDEKNIVFSKIEVIGQKIISNLYRSTKSDRNLWSPLLKIKVKGIDLATRIGKNSIGAASVLYQDNTTIIINGYDGIYRTTLNGASTGPPSKIEFYGGSLNWIDSAATTGIIMSSEKPRRIGQIFLKGQRRANQTQINSDVAVRAEKTTPPAQQSGFKPGGKYYGLLIGVSEYNLPSLKLDRPTHDAEELKKVLLSHYTFEENTIKILTNPSRQQILSELFNLRSVIQKDDHLLIFFAGHGFFDNNIQQGYWWPRDAALNDPSNWLSNSDLREQIRGIHSAHTLLISDACFSGGIFKTRGVNDMNIAPMEIKLLMKTPSRRAITSGNLSSVPDQSVFFEYLVKRLSENSDPYLPSQSLFTRLKLAVINNSLNIPQDGVISDSGDEGGDFIFIRR